MTAVGSALHHLPPGCGFAIANGAPIPGRYLAKDGKLNWDVLDMYHGTFPHAVPSICEKGFVPGFGAGAEHLLAHFGVPVAGVYLAKSWLVAMYYPQGVKTTRPMPEDRGGVTGSSRIDDSGTQGLRVVLRVIVKSNENLMHKGTSQSL